ncbi:hypothetical protein [Paraburkholderia domus]|nr:hypothetical protein [Paraburkholderia domus]
MCGDIAGDSLAWRQLLFRLHMPRAVIFGERSLPHPDADRLSKVGIAVSIVQNVGHFMMRDNPAGLASAIDWALSGWYSGDA